MFTRRTQCTCLCIFGVIPIHECRMQQAPHAGSEGWQVMSFCVRSMLAVVRTEHVDGGESRRKA